MAAGVNNPSDYVLSPVLVKPLHHHHYRSQRRATVKNKKKIKKKVSCLVLRT
jgi:hypothetical protein